MNMLGGKVAAEFVHGATVHGRSPHLIFSLQIFEAKA
jgi:hypothetical protein